MAIGENLGIKDKLIKNTEHTNKASNKSKEGKADKEDFKRKTDIVGDKNNVTSNTVKMTFYVKAENLKRLYNFAYWDRHNVTEAFNIVLADGLKGKNTKDKEAK